MTGGRVGDGPPLRVLHAIPGLTVERGGPTAVLSALAAEQVRQGHRVTVVTTDQGVRNGETFAEPTAGVAWERLPTVGPARTAFARGLNERMRWHLSRADVCHVHSLFTYPVHVAWRQAAALGVPVVLRACGLLHSYSLRRRRLAKRAYLTFWGGALRRAVTAWHYTSPAEARGSYPGPAFPQFVLPNGVVVPKGEPDRAAARRRLAASLLPGLPADPDVPVLLFLGRLHAKKRLDVLLEAFAEAGVAGATLVVAGPDEGNQRRRLADRSRELGVADRVRLLDTVRGPDKDDLLAAATLFALPSEHENFAVAAAEALAAGTPAVVSPAVDLAEVVGPGAGVETLPLRPAAWAEGLRQQLGTPEAVRRLAAAGRSGRQRAAELLTWPRLTASLTEHYWDAIGRVQGKAAEELEACAVSPAS